MEAVADVLERAAAHMEEHGFCQGVTEDIHGRVCVVGAIYAATERRPHRRLSSEQRRAMLAQRDAAVVAVERCLGLAPRWMSDGPGCGVVGFGVGDWNDVVGRTQAQAVAALRSAAAQERG
jgi:hypothetical protein